MKKQTTVEWLVNELKKSKHYQHMINEVHQNSTVAIDVIDQALAMEKEQILEFTRNAVRKILDEDRQNPFNLEQYYNETYKGGQDA